MWEAWLYDRPGSIAAIEANGPARPFYPHHRTRLGASPMTEMGHFRTSALAEY